MEERNKLSERIDEVSKDFVHALTLDTNEPFILFEHLGDCVKGKVIFTADLEIGRINDTDHLEYLKQGAIESKRKDLVALGANEKVHKYYGS